MMSSELTAVDASVAVKWQLDDEECVTQARALRNDFYGRNILRIVAPTLMVYELANVLVTCVRRRRIAVSLAVEAMADLVTVGVELREVNPTKILETALHYDVSAYDAAYLALAEVEECVLWTGDRHLHNAVAKKLAWVRWIGDYASP
ncbi:MAG: type II toxin-antitoxin system VapC family toxin [Chloroflexi bacterium]|nr:type II toxin-antitoxin system VapC family toxin [Chloroflexota bacterium]